MVDAAAPTMDAKDIASLPPSRRSSSVSSATTVAALRTAGFRGRAALSADEKRVTFRTTPSVRYFKSTHTASFGTDDSGDADEDANEQHPQWRAMRSRRTRRQLKPSVVESEPIQHSDEPTQQLVRKIAEAAQQHMTKAVDELLEGSTAGWTRRGDANGKQDEATQTWERRPPHTHDVIVQTTLPCRFRELQRVLETTALDELDAALLACTHERIDKAVLVETVETTTAQIREDQESEKAALYLKGQATPPALATTKDNLDVKVTRVVLPRTKLAEAANVWRRVRRGDASESTTDTQKVELIDATVTDTGKALSVSRVLQQMASLSEADHALVGDMQVGYVLHPTRTSPHETTVTLFISRKRKAGTKSFAWTAHSISELLIARFHAIPTVLWSFIERRRFGFQGLTYPDLVYCVSDLDEVQADVSHCPLCASEFGFLRWRHFCHVCALWVCVKCSSDQDVETDSDGWTMDTVKICVACNDRVHECVFDYDRGAVSPAQPLMRSDPAIMLRLGARHLTESWIYQLQTASSDRERHAYSVVLETLMKLLSPDEVCDLRLSDLQADWEDLAPDELSEPVEELAEMLPLPSLSTRQCMLSHDATRRQYVLLFDDERGYPQSPTTVDDSDRVRHVEKLLLLEISSLPSLDALCALAATVLECQLAFVSAITADRSIRLSSYGTSVKERARDDGFCAYTLQSMYPLVVLDLARDVRSRHFTLTTEEHGRFYCGVPLLSPDETFVMATFAVVGTRPRDALSTTAYAMFTVFARAARAVLVHELEEYALEPASGA